MATAFNKLQIKKILDDKVKRFNEPSFIANDPISIPHSFNLKNDIEISGFLTATIAWGNRKSIITNAKKMMVLLDNSPHDFIVNHSESDLKHFSHFVHRTFNLDDFLTFIQCLKVLYTKRNGLEGLFNINSNHEVNIANFPENFFCIEVPHRSRKHVAKITSNSAGKRLNMFLRWMVRNDNKGVDFGLWKNLSPADLFIPLDVHSGNSARKLGLLDRKQNDWKSVLQLTEILRAFDSEDPIKYDYALFGMGVMEKTI